MTVRIDHTAHLDQLLPIPTVAGEARDLARRDGANLAEAHLCYHSIEAGTLDPARCGAAKIVIDHFDLGPAERGHGLLTLGDSFG
jgi:hypothetical protein